MFSLSPTKYIWHIYNSHHIYIYIKFPLNSRNPKIEKLYPQIKGTFYI